MRLILIRHGQTKWNQKRRYLGFTDIDLDKSGRQQAVKLSQRLQEERIDRIYSSGMKRTSNFCRIALQQAACKELPEFREIDFGRLEGLTYKKALEKFPATYKKWLFNPLANHVPGTEKLSSFAARVRKGLMKILRQNWRGTVVVFTHAGPIRVILCDILKKDLRKIWQIKQDSGNINIIKFTGGKGKILLQNDTAYLHE